MVYGQTVSLVRVLGSRTDTCIRYACTCFCVYIYIAHNINDIIYDQAYRNRD